MVDVQALKNKTKELRQFRCLWDWVLVRPLPPGETSGGIALPDSAAEDMEHTRAVVERAGPGRYSELGKLVPMNVKEGDTVMAAFRYDPIPIYLDGRTYLLLREPHLMGVFDESS